MKQVLLRLAAALLAFGVGVLLANSSRALKSEEGATLPPLEIASYDSLIHEAALRGELRRLRTVIDQYAGDHDGYYPASLDELVRAGYLREVPADPVTGERGWQVEEFVCPASGQRYFEGVVDVRSKSSALSSEGTPYSEW